ncbi:MAG: FKBP-type peptidyl-prolyl cis-trans isomerase [Verrucomicrobiota bacterium]
MFPATAIPRTLVALATAIALTISLSAEPAMPVTPPDVKAAPADAEKTSSGLASKILKPGTGDKKPSASDTVTVHYSGWTTDGNLFDSSVKRGQPTSFPLNGVIPGWTEGLQLMAVGEQRRFWIPANLAYGENPGGGRPGGLLVFDVELLEIKEGPKPPPVPEDIKAPPADAEKTASGLTTKLLAKGTSDKKPTAQDIVTIKATLWTTEGQLIAEIGRDRPAAAPLEKFSLKGLVEGIGLMTAGEKRRMWIPQTLTFGDTPPPGAPAGTIVADVELISIKSTPTAQSAPAAPTDVAAAPANAEKTASGLASRVLAKGTGTVHPKATDTVEVHYSGWTTDGKLFDSSVQRGEPIQFPLNGVIKGWTEGVQLMVEGEKRRFWIPAVLGYGENPSGGAPAGTLVFDVELIKIVK